jgi:alkylation response protein AidB-like acyl-CoA dehydrogenase
MSGDQDKPKSADRDEGTAQGTPQDVTEEFVTTIRQWVKAEVIPRVAEFESVDRYPEAWVEQLKAFGLFGARIDPRHGGLGLDTLTYAQLMEELAYGWMSLTGVVNTHTMAATLISRFGSEDQRTRWLPDMATGARRGAFSLSEPDAGSDTQAIRCRAVRDGEEYVLTGTKMWVTNGERASIVALAARTDEGITCFIVEKDPGPSFEGITVSRNIEKLGYKGIETVEMTYDGHRVPASSVLGGPEGLGRGLSYILGSLELGRINVAARSVGVARAAYDAAMHYALERQTFGVPIVKHQAIQFKLADMATRIEASRLLVENAARRFDEGKRSDVEAGMAKLFCSETALYVAIEAMRIHGGYGYTKEFPLERYFRDAPLMIIGEGTNEIQRIVIARGLVARWKGTES